MPWRNPSSIRSGSMAATRFVESGGAPNIAASSEPRTLPIAKAEGASGQAHDLFIRLPDTLDPRSKRPLR